MIDHRESTLARAAWARAWVVKGERLSAVAGAIGRGLVGAVKAVRRWQARNAARAALEGLDDRLLRDIGLRRDQIEPAVQAMFRKPPVPVASAAPNAVETGVTPRRPANDADYKSAA